MAGQSENIEFLLLKNGDFFDSPVSVKTKSLPNAGDLINIAHYFPDFLKKEWELKEGIEPFGRVKKRVFYGDTITVYIETIASAWPD